MKLIVAADDANGIAAGGRIPWHIPEDMRRFKALTMGGTVVMGRKTWDSLPERAKPLPGRVNVVMSISDTVYAWSNRPVSMSVTSFDELLALRDDARARVPVPDPMWIIGGGQIYAEAMRLGLVTDIYLTRVSGDFECDVRWPGVPRGWICEVEGPPSDSLGVRYEFQHWSRT